MPFGRSVFRPFGRSTVVSPGSSVLRSHDRSIFWFFGRFSRSVVVVLLSCSVFRSFGLCGSCSRHPLVFLIYPSVADDVIDVPLLCPAFARGCMVAAAVAVAGSSVLLHSGVCSLSEEGRHLRVICDTNTLQHHHHQQQLEMGHALTSSVAEEEDLRSCRHR